MKQQTNTPDARDLNFERLAEDVKALLAATENVAEDKVVEARERLADALNVGKATWARVQEHAVEGAKAADHAIRKHPYQAIGIAFGVGALVGVLFLSRD